MWTSRKNPKVKLIINSFFPPSSPLFSLCLLHLLPPLFLLFPVMLLSWLRVLVYDWVTLLCLWSFFLLYIYLSAPSIWFYHLFVFFHSVPCGVSLLVIIFTYFLPPPQSQHPFLAALPVYLLPATAIIYLVSQLHIFLSSLMSYSLIPSDFVTVT